VAVNLPGITIVATRPFLVWRSRSIGMRSAFSRAPAIDWGDRVEVTFWVNVCLLVDPNDIESLVKDLSGF